MGTLGFMPPEQARGRWEQVDARTDLWAVGATMYALLTGRHVHVAATANEQLLLAMTKPAPPIASVMPEISPAIASVVDRALQYETADRWESAKAMQQAVRDAYTTLTGRTLSLAPRLIVPDAADGSARLEVGHAATVLATSGSIGGRKPRRGGKSVALLGAAALVALTGTVAVLATRRGAHEEHAVEGAPVVLATPSAASDGGCEQERRRCPFGPTNTESVTASASPSAALSASATASAHTAPPWRRGTGVVATGCNGSARRNERCAPGRLLRAPR